MVKIIDKFCVLNPQLYVSVYNKFNQILVNISNVKEKGVGSAPGKVIISGDHSVVYGYPAIATALKLRCSVIAEPANDGLILNATDLNEEIFYTSEQLLLINKGNEVHGKLDGIARAVTQVLENRPIALKLSISSDIPISAGLGSSAAVAVATMAAISDLYELQLDKQRISELAFLSEQLVHGKPSGIDNSIATYGGFLIFEKGNIDLCEINTKLPLIIINSKEPRDTKKLVGNVRALREKYSIIDDVLKTMGATTQNVIKTIEDGDLLALGDLLNINQGLLDTIGVGHSKLSDLIWRVRKAGALGAKLTGAGGGGCMIVLLPSIDESHAILKELQGMDVDILITEASTEGVRIGS